MGKEYYFAFIGSNSGRLCNDADRTECHGAAFSGKAF
jgi:hypothetical protein